MSGTEADQQEPSMEEILASIRKIISEDGKEGEEQPPAISSVVAEEGLAVAGAPDDVLELTHLVGEEGDAESLGGSENSAQAQGRDESAVEPVGEIFEAEETPSPVGTDSNGLLSEDKAAATADAFADLLRAMPVTEPLGAGGQALQEIVKPVMRPLLRQWLDDNLPPLVERIIREEIERVVKRARDQ